MEVVSYSSYFLLPDCFYRLSNSITAISLDTIIIQGNSSFPDPLERLALAISSSPTSIEITQCRIATDTGSDATINWNALSTIISSVDTLRFDGTNLGIGSTIPTFPRPIAYLTFTRCGLGGPLPDTLFASATPGPDFIHFSAGTNALNGSIPSSLLSNLDFASLSSFRLSLDNNALTGIVPSTLLQGSFSASTSIAVGLSSNRLEGPLSNVFASSNFSSVLGEFSFYGDNNEFTGPTPNWLSSMPSLEYFTFSCSNCKLQSLTPSFLGVSTKRCRYDVSMVNSSISGGIPSTFFQTGGSVASLVVDLPGNRLTNIPSDMLDSTNMTSAGLVRINVSSNLLTGNLPNSPGVFGPVVPSSYFLDISNNPSLTGIVPTSFLSTFGATPTNTTAAILLIAENTGLTGNLALPDLSLGPKLKLTIRAKSTNFASLTIPEHASSGLASLSISSSSPLTGQLPTSFFINNPDLQTLDIPHSELNGSMPDMGTSNPLKLTTLILSASSMDFCSGTRATWTSSTLQICTLSTTLTFCQDTYPAMCSFSAPPPLSPTPSSISSPSGCSQSTRPSAEWTCIDGTWTFVGSVVSTTVVIPSGATTTTIKGNLTSSTVIINGLNSIIKIDGCTSNTTIIVELTPQQLEEIGRDGKLQQLLSFSNASMCNSSTSDLNIGTHVKGSSCKTVSVSKVPSSNGSFSGLFKIDSSGCNTWWIILVSVLCGLVLIGLVVAVIAYVIYKKRLEALAHKSLKQVV